MSARKLAIAALSAAALVVVAAPAQADAAAYVKRCTWWHLDGGDALVIDSLAKTTSCKAAKQLGDAYLKADRWYPVTLRAAGKTWRRIGQDHYDSDVEGCGGQNDLTYGSYNSTTWVARTGHARYMADLEYDIEDGC